VVKRNAMGKRLRFFFTMFSTSDDVFHLKCILDSHAVEILTHVCSRPDLGGTYTILFRDGSQCVKHPVFIVS
jgi:hypothetical protein